VPVAWFARSVGLPIYSASTFFTSESSKSSRQTWSQLDRPEHMQHLGRGASELASDSARRNETNAEIIWIVNDLPSRFEPHLAFLKRVLHPHRAVNFEAINRSGVPNTNSGRHNLLEASPVGKQAVLLI
jgi:hypothetical protein